MNNTLNKQEIIRASKFIGWIALFFIIIGAIIASINKKGTARIKAVNINVQSSPLGNDLITRGDIHELLNKSFGYSLEGLAHSELDIARIEKVLEETPFILDAEVFIDAENVVQIDIQQRIPILRIIDKMGVSYYLDKEGNRLPLSKNFTARVLIASGNIPPFIPDFKERKEHLLKYTFDLARIILDNEFLWSMVEQIYINNKSEFIIIPKLGKQKILLGLYEHISDKLENLEVFYKKAMAQEGWQKYETLDLKYKAQIVGVK